jgi:alpha-amylase/alpha-mannosidase (GH57 family)
LSDEIHHALVLNLHQPAGNLDELLDADSWQATEILYALDRIPRALWRHEDTARVHLSLSGTLLETLTAPGFQERVYGIVDCGSLLWHLQNTRIIRILGTAYYHPVLPLIPPADREEQLTRWRGIGRHLLARDDFAGFWPPEMGFTMELIPLLRRLGYRYVLVDSAHVEPVTPMRWEQLRYRPHIARWGDDEIVVVVRDRELSDAQESGMATDWFIREVRDRTRWCDTPPLVTTCTDGDNGGWFRNMAEEANFWPAFHDDLMRRVARGEAGGIRPTFIEDYLDRYGTHGEVTVHDGAWNTGWHDGASFTQWTGSAAQREALARVAELSAALRAGGGHAGEEALWPLLRAQTSCNFYWGEAWLPRAHADLDMAERALSPRAPSRSSPT